MKSQISWGGRGTTLVRPEHKHSTRESNTPQPTAVSTGALLLVSADNAASAAVLRVGIEDLGINAFVLTELKTGGALAGAVVANLSRQIIKNSNKKQ